MSETFGWSHGRDFYWEALGGTFEFEAGLLRMHPARQNGSLPKWQPEQKNPRQNGSSQNGSPVTMASVKRAVTPEWHMPKRHCQNGK